jgi:hypothetical protein
MDELLHDFVPGSGLKRLGGFVLARMFSEKAGFNWSDVTLAALRNHLMVQPAAYLEG